MGVDICCKCNKPIAEDQPRYGASFEPCHWDCRPDYALDRETDRVKDILRRGDAALAELKRLARRKR